MHEIVTEVGTFERLEVARAFERLEVFRVNVVHNHVIFQQIHIIRPVIMFVRYFHGIILAILGPQELSSLSNLSLSWHRPRQCPNSSYERN